jgi:hypothetical protein
MDCHFNHPPPSADRVIEVRFLAAVGLKPHTMLLKLIILALIVAVIIEIINASDHNDDMMAM